MGKRNYETHYDPETRVFTKKFNDENETTITVNVGELPQNSQSYIEGYGITQIENDCHAGAKSIEEMIAASRQKADDLSQGVIRRRSAGLGIGVDLEKLTQALANTNFSGNVDQAREALAPFVPNEDEDDEELVKQKKARLRAIRNMGEIKVEIDRINGKSTSSLLDAPLATGDEGDEGVDEAQASA